MCRLLLFNQNIDHITTLNLIIASKLSKLGTVTSYNEMYYFRLQGDKSEYFVLTLKLDLPRCIFGSVEVKVVDSRTSLWSLSESTISKNKVRNDTNVALS